MNYSTVLFDLDGTITNPSQGITNSVAYALDFYGNSYESKKALEAFIGPPLREQFMKYCNVDRDMGENYVKKYREFYSVKGIYQNEVYSGIEEMLSKLKNAGIKVVLATSKPEEFAKIILDHFNLSCYFDFVAGALMDNTRTNKAEVIKYALECIHQEPCDEIIMVGDRRHDIEGAHQVGLKAIGVTFGFGSKDELDKAQAEKIVSTVDELSQALMN
ncbi:MAG: HAD-IA family hydrolase [Clostridia bacterium]|nr:HAD-IA family hydrolase [Clostridia bacterium]